MSLIEIRKYEYLPNRAKNYFASPAYIDGITLDNILIDGFPIFNEEFANQFDSFEYKASDYDLVFSRLENTLTTTLNQSLEAFLSTNLDNHCLVAKVTIGSKTFGGLIDVNSISFIDDLTSDGYRIKITIFGLAKEYSLATQGKPAVLFGDINLVITQVLGFCVDGFAIDPFYRTFEQSKANFVTRIGYNPVIISELWSFIQNSSQFNNVVAWKLFEDLCTSFGLIYKFEITGDYSNYFIINISIAFRDTGFSSDTISVNWLHRERGFISDINANVIQCFKHQKEEPISAGTQPATPNETHFYGTVFNKNDITTADGYVYVISGGTGEESLYSNGDGVTINKLSNPFPFDTVDKVNFIQMNYYFDIRYAGSSGQWIYYILVDGDARLGWLTTRQPKYISFPRMFTKAGYVIGGESNLTTHNPRAISHPENIHTLWATLIENTGGACYPYLLSTFKKFVSGKISLLNDFNVNLFNKITVNEETYTIFKLSNLDFNNKEVDVYAIQD